MADLEFQDLNRDASHRTRLQAVMTPESQDRAEAAAIEEPWRWEDLEDAELHERPAGFNIAAGWDLTVRFRDQRASFDLRNLRLDHWIMLRRGRVVGQVTARRLSDALCALAELIYREVRFAGDSVTKAATP